MNEFSAEPETNDMELATTKRGDKVAGRKKKAGIEFSAWDVDVFGNRKIERLVDRLGLAAFTVFFCVCQRIYATNGYYMDWTAEDAPTIKKTVGGEVDTGFVVRVVDMCLDLELFAPELYALHGVLTSRHIQQNFAVVLSGRRRKEVVAEYWMLAEEDSSGAVPVPRVMVE